MILSFYLLGCIFAFIVINKAVEEEIYYAFYPLELAVLILVGTALSWLTLVGYLFYKATGK